MIDYESILMVRDPSLRVCVTDSGENLAQRGAPALDVQGIPQGLTPIALPISSPPGGTTPRPTPNLGYTPRPRWGRVR